MKKCLECECTTYKDKRCCTGCENIKTCFSPCDLAKNTKDIFDCAYMLSK